MKKRTMMTLFASGTLLLAACSDGEVDPPEDEPKDTPGIEEPAEPVEPTETEDVEEPEAIDETNEVDKPSGDETGDVDDGETEANDEEREVAP